MSTGNRDSPFTPKPGNQDNVLQPITQNDVRAAKINWRQSAQDPDKNCVGCVKLVSEEKLTILNNVLLLRNVQTTSWTRTNTTLIPKGGDLKTTENWRPITIESAVQRLFHRILVKRLKVHVELSTHQTV
jgi:Ca2+-dependent lipid-binding protein